jgi:magnesium transporter
MSDSISHISDKAGMPPGSLVHIGDVVDAKSGMSVLDYSKETIEEQGIQSIEEILPYIDKNTITWLNVEGLQDVKLIESIGGMLNIHPLVLEDILNTHQRPKFEEFDDYLYIVLKKLVLEDSGFSVSYEQISILVLDNFVVTFKERKDDIFVPLKQRLRNSKGRLRNMGSDYLTYAILDTIVDQVFILLDSLDDLTESTEEELLTNPKSDTLVNIQRMKRELIHIRKSISPLREMLAAILRCDSILIHEKTDIYFRDVYDHVLRITESIETYRDVLSGLLDIYMSSVSNKMNEVMKVLTVFASIFIPLTFIAGIYGMNFEYMPELKWKWAYPTLWISFISIPVVLLIYFKKKKWL